jgi:hypothetical protein
MDLRLLCPCSGSGAGGDPQLRGYRNAENLEREILLYTYSETLLLMTG